MWSQDWNKDLLTCLLTYYLDLSDPLQNPRYATRRDNYEIQEAASSESERMASSYSADQSP